MDLLLKSESIKRFNIYVQPGLGIRFLSLAPGYFLNRLLQRFLNFPAATPATILAAKYFFSKNYKCNYKK